jgi:CYTH domain-containing protein
LLAKSGERRLRRVTTEIIGEFDYICKFFYTEKHPLSQDGLVREENEVSITYREYLKLMQEADSTLHKINKTRYTFYIDEQAYELDIYDFDTNYAILEIEMPTENTPYKWPDSLVLVKDVTSDKRFKNRSISETLQFPVI